MLKKTIFIVIIAVILGLVGAFSGYIINIVNDKKSKTMPTHTNNANDLVARKGQVDMRYRELMQILGEGSNLIHKAIISQNREMAILGLKMIDNHHAPKEKPWLIMAKNEQNSFKESLIAYDKLLHNNVSLIEKAINKRDWYSAIEGLNNLNLTCVSCHSIWKNKVK